MDSLSLFALKCTNKDYIWTHFTEQGGAVEQLRDRGVLLAQGR